MLQQQLTGKIMAGGAFALNIVSINYGVIFAFAQYSAPLQALFGPVLVATFIFNLSLTYWNYKKIAKRGLQRWGTAYLVISMSAMVILPAAGFAASSSYDPRTAMTILIVAVYPPFLTTLFIGAIQAGKTYSAHFDTGRFTCNESHTGKASINLAGNRKILLAFLLCALASGVFLAYILLSRYPGLLQVVISPNALFLAFFYPALAILIIKIYNRPRNFLSIATFTLGLCLMIIFILPLLMTLPAVNDAENSFKSAYGENWRDQIDPAAKNHILLNKFSLPAYFLGFSPGSYNYQKDILFFEGTAGIDKGIKLYCDVFRPPPEKTDLPGIGSTIIRIHGGAWIAGDKGIANMMQMNSYLASQGYTVFDIQYGLTDRVTLPQMMIMYDFLDGIATSLPLQSSDFTTIGAPDSVTGPFTLDDMIRHLGLFSHFLVQNADEYGASPDSVFISGGSAGGHLATAMALAIAGGEHSQLFNPQVNVKGYIPFYPANRATKILEQIGGSAEWVDVEKLVRRDSPPCLIFQGTKDGMVPKETALLFKKRYLDAGNKYCKIIYMPLAAHAADYLFTGYYNQAFLYYMERFMLMHQ